MDTRHSNTHSDGGDVLLSRDEPRRWTPVVFGVVSQTRIRRRPGDFVRVGITLIVVLLAAATATDVTAQDKRTYDLLRDVPSWIETWCSDIYWIGTVGTTSVALIVLLATRRFRLTLIAAGTGATTFAIAMGLRTWLDVGAERAANGLGPDPTPEFPCVELAVAAAVVFFLAPFLVRPVRRAMQTAIFVSALAAFVAIIGLGEDVVVALVLGWGVAAASHLVFGTPAATPDLGQVEHSLDALGVTVDALELAPDQVWGEARFTGIAPDGQPLAIDVIGRDAGDARLATKFARSILYRDSGPSLALTRPLQLEHRAYVHLLAERAGVPVGVVVIAGIAGAHEDAMFVVRDSGGTPLRDVDADQITDGVLDDAWANIARLHGARLAHGQLNTGNVRLRDDGSTVVVDFGHASTNAPSERRMRDCVEFIATTAVIVGPERALAAAERNLGKDGLGELLPLFESAALTPSARKAIPDTKKFLTALREQGAQLAEQEVPKLAELRRVSPGDVVMAAATFLGIYLILAQFAGVDLWATLQDAQWEWVVAAFLLSPLPQFCGAISLQGSVAVPLPYVPVLAEQFANNFTGLIGGTLATTALVIRFFQKQGLAVAVAASSGVMNSLAGGIVQVTLVVVGLVATSGDYSYATTGGDGDDGNIIRLVVIGVILMGIAIAVALLVPRLRRLIQGIVQPQYQAAKANLTGILTTPRKAAMLFGGNLASQLIFAAVLACSLHAYGGSVPYLQLIVINSFASVVGGMAPVPGGMGVVEAGLIAGLTASGVPDSIAVATVFTSRLFTAYLPPIWGWFALNWLRREDYV